MGIIHTSFILEDAFDQMTCPQKYTIKNITILVTVVTYAHIFFMIVYKLEHWILSLASPLYLYGPACFTLAPIVTSMF